MDKRKFKMAPFVLFGVAIKLSHAISSFLNLAGAGLDRFM